MITVWKYLPDDTVADDGGWRVSIPRGGQIVHVATQHERPCMWILVDTDQPLEERLFRAYGTGHPVAHEPGGDMQHAGTWLLEGGALVLHLFEVLET